MKIRGITFAQVEEIVNQVSRDRYEGNIEIRDGREETRCGANFTIRPTDSHGLGARRSGSGRRGPWACWHAHRDVMYRIFRLNREARVFTTLFDYRGMQSFLDNYLSTGERNIGSVVQPAYMPDLCECEVWPEGNDFKYGDPEQIEMSRC